MGEDADIQARRILLLAAHPNDEFGIVATLRSHVDLGDDVWVAWFARDDRDDVWEVRSAEGRRVLGLAGIPEDHLVEAGLPALDLTSQLPEVVRAANDVRESLQPDRVYVAAFEGGHPDHDALNFAAWEAFSVHGVEVLEFPLYHRAERRWTNRVPAFGHLLPGIIDPYVRRLSPGERGFKHGAWRQYRTQKPLFDVLLRLSGDQRTFFSAEETRPLPLRDYTKPPHEPPLLYEEHSDWFYSFAEFASAVRRYHWNGGASDDDDDV